MREELERIAYGDHWKLHIHAEPLHLVSVLGVREEVHVKTHGEAKEPVLEDIVVEVGKDIGSKGEEAASKHEGGSQSEHEVHVLVQLELVGSCGIEVKIARDAESNMGVAAEPFFGYCGEISVQGKVEIGIAFHYVQVKKPKLSGVEIDGGREVHIRACGVIGCKQEESTDKQYCGNCNSSFLFSFLLAS